MQISDLQSAALYHRPLLRLGGLRGHNRRRRYRAWLIIAVAVLALIALIAEFASRGYGLSSLEFLSSNRFRIRALALLLFVFFLMINMAESFFYSRFVRASLGATPVSYFLAEVMWSSAYEAPVAGFAGSPLGQEIMERLEISERDVREFLVHNNGVVSTFSLSPTDATHISLAEYAGALYDSDKDYSSFLFEHGVTKEMIIGVSTMVEENAHAQIMHERWWSENSLADIDGIGQSFSYGETFTLKRFARLIGGEMALSKVSRQLVAEDVTSLEGILQRSREADALVVTRDEGTRNMILESLSQRIHERLVAAPLLRKRIYLLDGNALVSSTGDKAVFEQLFNRVLSEAASAGNIILAINNFASIIRSARVLGSDIVSLMTPYVISANIQLIILVGYEAFHQDIATNRALIEHFEVLQVKEKEGAAIRGFAVGQARLSERETGMIFSYPALLTLASSSERYFMGSSVSDKIEDLIIELIPKVRGQGRRLITRSDVLGMVSEKTGVPAGEATEKEKDVLLNLESILHKRVVGQEEAVNAISESLRRARAGLGNTNKPMGSFLFLGPTGVGKTETAKSLAEAFFGSERDILRLDMSEFSGADALNQLVGSFETGKPGRLVNMLREKSYGVVLLDEFEKASSEVHNLFLQILDEGVFSDMQGKRVNARNVIFIATSNAGSDLIWQALESGASVQDQKATIVEAIIKRGTYRPELLNRFDAVILFHPIVGDDLEEVARRMLAGLVSRLRNKGIDLTVTDELVNFLMRYGSDPKFGARPMNRAISEHVEEVIAKGLLSGSIKKGSHITLAKDPSNSARLIVQKP